MRLPLIFVGLLVLSGLTAVMAQDRVVPRTSNELKASFSPVVNEAAPAVVNIYTRGVVQTRRRSVFDDDPFFRDFFGRGFGSMPRERVTSSLGSGVIVRPSGVIVTNNHVVEGMSEIRVVLNDRREFNADILLADEKTDLAILQIDAGEALPFVEFADSDAAAVGDIVLAIGNPFGVGQTVTSGIVSALARTQVGVSDFQFFIQTDAAINPGNSGGALVDVDGRLLGINTAIYSRSGGSNGIGFAIPGNLVRQVVASALDGDGTLHRPWLGAATDTVDRNMALALGLDRAGGVILNDLFPDGPADRAGLEAGDVITRIGDFDVFDAGSAKYRIATRKEGDRVTVTYLRDGRERTATLRLAVPPMDPAPNETLVTGRNPFQGATIANLSPALAEELGRSPMDRGVVVRRVEGGGYAARFGLRPDTRIISVNGETVDRVEDLLRIVSTPTRGWIIQTEDRNGRRSTMRLSF